MTRREKVLSQPIASISEFLIHAGTDYRVFDMGRCIRQIDSQQFLDIENGQCPAPFPRQQHAWFGITYWNKQLSTQQYIWFLKLPLDEQGHLVDASRQHFLELIVTALSEQNSENKKQDDPLAGASQVHQNPYIFTPNQQQLADYNAISRLAANLPESKDFNTALQYLNTPHLLDWQKVSLQGLADAMQFSNDSQLIEWLTNINDKYPVAVIEPMLCSLENRPLSSAVAKVIMSLIKPEEINARQQLVLLRACTQGDCQSHKQTLIDSILAQPQLSQDTLTVLVGRFWNCFSEHNLMRLLEHIACASDAPADEFFVRLFADIAQLPDTRAPALAALRNPERSERLSSAIGILFSAR